MTHPEDNAAPVIRIAHTGLFPFSTRLGLFFAAYFVLIGVYTPFFPVWLAAKGLDAREIGIVLAAPMLVRFFVVPVVTRLADRGGALRPALILCAFATLAGYVAIWLSSGFVAILVTVSLMAVPYSPTMALGDAYALRGLKDRHAYGPVRMWGSISFIVASIGVGYLFDVMAAKDLILLIIGAVFATRCRRWHCRRCRRMRRRPKPRSPQRIFCASTALSRCSWPRA